MKCAINGKYYTYVTIPNINRFEKSVAQKKGEERKAECESLGLWAPGFSG